MKHEVLHADETKLQVLHESGKMPQSESYENAEKLSFSDNPYSDFANINSCALPRSSVNIANTDFIDRLKPTEVSASSFLSDMRVRNLY